MSFRSFVVVFLLVVLAIFTVANWGTFVAPTELSLVVTRITAPLGLVMLGFVAVLIAVFLAYVLYVQMTALSASRRQAEELREQRQLADTAEASRFTELQQRLEQEFAALREAQQESEDRLRAELAAATNSLSACIGVVDDRLERQAKLSGSDPEGV